MATGYYTVPHSGVYLLHARVYSLDHDASHEIQVAGVRVTWTKEKDPDYHKQSTSTSVVLHLIAGQQVSSQSAKKCRFPYAPEHQKVPLPLSVMLQSAKKCL